MPRGCDHGLGGRNTENSKRKRAKRAERIKASAESRMKVTKGVKEIVFDENAREEYLTGFRKRKTERRKFGLAMQIVKDTKMRKEAVKARKADIMRANQREKDKLREAGGVMAQEDSDDDEDDVEGDEDGNEGDDSNSSKKLEESVFADESTTSMFGASVSVVVNTDVSTGGADGSDDGEGGDSDEEELRKAKQRLDERRVKRMGKPLTKLERALKKVAATGGLQKKKKVLPKGGGAEDSKFGRNKKKGEGSAAGKALLHKAMGSGIVGGFKGKGKGKKGGRK